jgi:hypothetical protein
LARKRAHGIRPEYLPIDDVEVPGRVTSRD